MKRRSLHAVHPIGRVNVTPMIDVVMVLIVFYLIVGKLAADRLAEVPLPRTETGETEATRDPLVINVVDDSGLVRIEGVDLRTSDLRVVLLERLAQDPGAVVQIRGHRELAYGAIRPVVEACRGAGVGGVRLAAERPR
jgi:biopolymer transport protein TolR